MGSFCWGPVGATPFLSIPYGLIDKMAPSPAKFAVYLLGGVPERSKGSDCKSDGSAFGGSNPPPSTARKARNYRLETAHRFRGVLGAKRSWPDAAFCARHPGCVCQFLAGGCSSMVEPQPSKLMMWVRFPSPAPAQGAEDRTLRTDSRLSSVFGLLICPYSSVGRALPW